MTAGDQQKMEQSAGAMRLPLIADSFARLTGERLAAMGADLWNSSAVTLAHDTKNPPCFFYGNAATLSLFAMTPAEFIGLPSYKSAEPDLREERAAMFAQLESQNIVHDYSGIRIAKNGQRFRFTNGIVWNLIDQNGAKHGQAARFSDWEML